MDKLNCVEDYFASTRAYYLFHLGNYLNKPEYLDFILDKRCLNGAKVAFISNIMLGIKEDLVATKGAMDYRSKLFLNSLEKSVGCIATKVSNGYKLGNYIFPDAATLVAILRNKLAHGKYMIDFVHNRVILDHKGVDIVINIDKLLGFIIYSFNNTIRNVRNTKYERSFVYLFKKDEKLINGRLKDENDVKKIIKSFSCVKFKIESLDGTPVFPEYIKYFESFLETFRLTPYSSKSRAYYKKVEDYLRKNNYKISMEYIQLKNNEEIDKIAKFISSEILLNDSLSYQHQLQFIGAEVQRVLDKKINSFDSLMANINNLILLDSIDATKSVNKETLSSYIADKVNSTVRFSYDEYGVLLLSMFNSLFLYPFDDVFETSGEYKLDREDSFDFSEIDLSMVKPLILNIDESPLNNALERCNSLVKRQNDINQRLIIQKNNLSKVRNNAVASRKINDSINDLTNALSLLMVEYIKADSEYNMIKNDYLINKNHFENRAIIEGIRNAIAHGNYEFNINGDFFDTVIVFNDIYEGKNTFQLKISFRDFEDMISKNYDVVLDYVRDKNKSKSKK